MHHHKKEHAPIIISRTKRRDVVSLLVMSPPRPARSASSFREAFSTFSWFLPENVIDDDTLSYLFDALESGLGEDDREEFKDFVAPLLLELFDDDDEAARKACENLHDAIFVREDAAGNADDDEEKRRKREKRYA